MTRKGERLWVITEATNEVGLRYGTTLLLPRNIELTATHLVSH